MDDDQKSVKVFRHMKYSPLEVEVFEALDYFGGSATVENIGWYTGLTHSSSDKCRNKHIGGCEILRNILEEMIRKKYLYSNSRYTLIPVFCGLYVDQKIPCIISLHPLPPTQ